ncbi:hypothetical protein [Staphylococcus warneri]|nr:hypothetical protein [Staphylococcus warneri]
MNKLQLIKIALLTALLVEEVRNARKIEGNFYIEGYQPGKANFKSIQF